MRFRWQFRRAGGRRHKFVLMASARWESEDILEWAAYHRAIGFDHIYLYGNDDDPWLLQKRLLPYLDGPRPFITYTHWPAVGEQFEMFAHFLRNHSEDAEWAMVLDIDEFVVLRDVDDIGTFMQAFERSTDCVYFNWVCFGHNGFLKRDAQGILATRTRRAASVDVHTKMLWRTGKVTEALARDRLARVGLGWQHFWNGCGKADFRMCDVLHRDVSTYTDDWPHQAARTVQPVSDAMIRTAFVAHFMMKSEEDFVRRSERSLAGDYAGQAGWRELAIDGRHREVLRHWNAVEDFYLRHFWMRRFGPLTRAP